MKIFDIITPRRMTWVALAAAIAYAIVAFAVGGEAMWLLLAVPPLLLLSSMLWLRWLPAAWAGAILALVIALLGFGIGPVVGGILALIGMAAFVSELPHLHHPHAPGQLFSPHRVSGRLLIAWLQLNVSGFCSFRARGGRARRAREPMT